MVTKNEWVQKVEELQRLSVQLEKTVSVLTADDLDRLPKDGGWTIRHIVHHLADSVSSWDQFVRQSLTGQVGEFPLRWYLDTPQDEWAEIWIYASRDIRPSLDLYQACLEHMVSLLSPTEDPEGLALEISWKPGEKELVPLLEVVSFQPEHLAGHLKDINHILQVSAD